MRRPFIISPTAAPADLCLNGHSREPANLTPNRECRICRLSRQRLRRGTKMPRRGRAASLADRFWDKVQKAGPDECWLWTGSRAGGRCMYGRIRVNGRDRPAHQVSWELFHGRTFPSGLFACHTCDNSLCVNPAHIWPGTHSDNMRDMVAKDRHAGRSRPKDWTAARASA